MNVGRKEPTDPIPVATPNCIKTKAQDLGSLSAAMTCDHLMLEPRVLNARSLLVNGAKLQVLKSDKRTGTPLTSDLQLLFGEQPVLLPFLSQNFRKGR